DSKLSNVVYVDYQAFQHQLAQGIFSAVNEVVVANVHASEVLDAIDIGQENIISPVCKYTVVPKLLE
ncbi:Hypothetical protein FKW44_013594, partial [Caligus rogercresseyi]